MARIPLKFPRLFYVRYPNSSLNMNKDDALNRLQRYCTAQDRCHSEVRNKLLKLKVYGHTLEEVMADLIRDGFLDEERFAKSYARGKHKINAWGKNKIHQHLKMKRVSDYCIRKGLQEIDDDDYRSTLAGLIRKRVGEDPNLDYQEKQKLISYLLGKGYEYEVIKEALEQ